MSGLQKENYRSYKENYRSYYSRHIASVEELLAELDGKSWRCPTIWLRRGIEALRRSFCWFLGHRSTIDVYRSADPLWRENGAWEFHHGCKRCPYFRIEKPPGVLKIDNTPVEDLPLLIGQVSEYGYLMKKIRDSQL